MATTARNQQWSRGFSLVELLIVAAIIGLIVAIAIPNLLNGLQRSRQTRTISNLRTISNGLVIYHKDVSRFPEAPDLDDFTAVSDQLVPFIREVPVTDGWQNALQYRSDGDSYTIASFGANLSADQPWTGGITHSFDDDIVAMNGVFFQIPEGPQN